jgi:hypothetical protein
MPYQLRRRPLIQKPSRIPLLVRLPVLVQRPLEIVDREEQLLGAPLVERAEDAVVAHQRLELASERVALDPVFPLVSTLYLCRPGIKGLDRTY